jgi:integrase
MTILTPIEASEVSKKKPVWQWPIDLTIYDKRPILTEEERTALLSLGWHTRQARCYDPDRSEWVVIERLFRPLNDARLGLYIPDKQYHKRSSRDAVALILHACVTTGKAFWGWDTATWIDVFGPDHKTIQERFPGWVDGAVRPYMFGIAYLLNCFSEIHQLGKNNNVTLATRLFGPSLVEAAVDPILSTLEGWGYQSARHTATVPGLVCTLLLLNRSPHLADMTTDKIEHYRCNDQIPKNFRSKLYGVHRALAALGFVETPASYVEAQAPVIQGVNPEWLQWVERWTATSTLTPKVRQMYRCILLKVGRWLASEHPQIREPSQWTRSLCAEYLAMVQQVCVGDYTQRQVGLDDRLGEPLSPKSKVSYIVVLRAFFRDCQEWEWIPYRFNPTRALATPRSILALTGPEPRVIADELWAKLLWAGLNLEADDLPVSAGGHFYPLELMRALALVWLFGGLRSDEIARLRVGCIRWQTSTVDGEQQAICYLDVPPNKTGDAFTKPVDPLVGQAILKWEAVRPAQPTLLDRRTGERVHLLFCYRARRVAKQYLNQGLIPILCHKAGIPRSDVRGRITSHRARATIASQLYNAKEPMTLFELQAWLGHSSPDTTQYYAQITPTTLAKAYTDADYFARNVRTIEVLIDRDAIASGAAANGTPWQYFDLGHGYCTYSFFEQCPHRMACARCDFYLPKDSTKGQLLEAKDNLQRMLAMIPLNDEERAAVEDGTTALDQLLRRLVDVPTPSGPTPRQLAGKSEAVTPIQSIKTGANKQNVG